MRIFLLFLSLVIAPYVVRGQEGLSSPSTRTDGVAKRGDHVMGFSHEAATHHFYLFTDGGEIVVTANVPVDASTRDQIRAHLAHIAKMFAAGDFNAPMLIHDTNPPGTATMSKRKEQI